VRWWGGLSVEDLEAIKKLRVELREKEEKIRRQQLENLNQKIEQLENVIRQKSSEINRLQAEIDKLKFADVHMAVLRCFLEKKLGFDYSKELHAWENQIAELNSKIKSLQDSIAALQNELKQLSEKREIVEKRVVFDSEGLVNVDGSELTIKCPRCQTEFKFDMKSVGLFQNILSCRNANELRNVYRLVGDSHPISCPNCSNTIQVRIERLKF